MELKPTFSVTTLGCKVNQYDSWQLARELKALGFRQLPFGAPADVVIVNSCTVTHVAEAKSRKMLSKAKKTSPKGLIVFTGCMAEMLKQQGANLDNADISVGNTEKLGLAQLIAEQVHERWQAFAQTDFDQLTKNEPLLDEPDESLHERARAFLKVQEGCDKFCTFCIVPFTRGMPKSKPLEKVLEEAKELVDEFGFSEIVLTGVCLSLWGREFGMSLVDLLESLNNLDGLKRIRLSSLDPCDLDEMFVRTCSSLPKVCHHFHISLQSGDDEILQRMGRGYISADYLRLIELFRSHIPDAAFTTDVMVGFPSEMEQNFENTVRFVQEVGFMKLHVFRFSPRVGTEAAKFKGTVKPEVSEERSHRLIVVSKELWRKFAGSFIGETMDVLVERCQPISDNGFSDGFELSGLTSNYLRVRWVSKYPVSLGTIVAVRLRELDVEREIIGGDVTKMFTSPVICGKIKAIMEQASRFCCGIGGGQKEGFFSRW